MTTNERLFVAGLLDQWVIAIESADREGAIGILGQVEMADQAAHVVDTVLANPEYYGFSRRS